MGVKYMYNLKLPRETVFETRTSLIMCNAPEAAKELVVTSTPGTR